MRILSKLGKNAPEKYDSFSRFHSNSYFVLLSFKTKVIQCPTPGLNSHTCPIPGLQQSHTLFYSRIKTVTLSLHQVKLSPTLSYSRFKLNSYIVLHEVLYKVLHCPTPGLKQSPTLSYTRFKTVMHCPTPGLAEITF